ncbi:unnamed protein product [Parnassius mnemosyne]|uniref:Uncharacterized protein n=1 Tax=Parnassius mnemosyne TaxID=213953 RepID=A0AAV1M4J6_9NEOP
MEDKTWTKKVTIWAGLTGKRKRGSIDGRVEIETDQEIPDQTTAYCLILNDCIFEYKPLTNIVKKIS